MLGERKDGGLKKDDVDDEDGHERPERVLAHEGRDERDPHEPQIRGGGGKAAEGGVAPAEPALESGDDAEGQNAVRPRANTPNTKEGDFIGGGNTVTTNGDNLSV